MKPQTIVAYTVLDARKLSARSGQTWQRAPDNVTRDTDGPA